MVDPLVASRATVIVSEFVRIELAQASKAIANQAQAVSARERRLWRLHRWGDLQDVRENWYNRCITSYEHLLAQFRQTQEVAISRGIIERALDIMATFQLDSYDAIHAATALATGATTLATFDADFLKLSLIPSMNIQLIRY